MRRALAVITATAGILLATIAPATAGHRRGGTCPYPPGDAAAASSTTAPAPGADTTAAAPAGQAAGYGVYCAD